MIDRYFTISNFLLITAGVYLAVSGFYTLITAQLDVTVRPRVSLSQAKSDPVDYKAAPRSAYQAITKRNIFNVGTETVAPEPKTEKVDVDKLKETDLKLKLWGTVTGQDKRAYAVIEDTKAREQNLYRAGDSIQNAIVKLILREKVVLRVDDRDEVLAMEEVRSGSRRSERTRSGSDRRKKLPVSSYPRKIRLRSSQIEKAMENLGEIMQQANLRPHIVDGQAAGISITGIKPNAIFRKMRLRNGDVITGVNGDSIESVEDALKVVEQLSSGSNIQLQIKRRGREQTLDYSIE
ncbi:MAG: type II secretion system protein GspC [Desulfobacterales bacterium]|nr:type II secretion system protein GspC [Desulfobacterales bacterium]